MKLRIDLEASYDSMVESIDVEEDLRISDEEWATMDNIQKEEAVQEFVYNTVTACPSWLVVGVKEI